MFEKVWGCSAQQDLGAVVAVGGADEYFVAFINFIQEVFTVCYRSFDFPQQLCSRSGQLNPLIC